MKKNMNAELESPQSNIDMFFMLNAIRIADDYFKFLKQQVFNRIELPEKLSLNEIHVLVIIMRNGNRTSPRDIVISLRQDPATITRTTKKLRAMGLIDVVSNSSDKRSVDLVINEAGLAIAQRYQTIFDQALKAVSEKYNRDFNEDETRRILKSVERLSARADMLASERGALDLT